MKNKDWLILLVLICVYIFLLLFFKKEIFKFRFDESLIKKYFCSQDITNEPPCKRLFLSDEEIYLSTGYLYAKGADPSLFNFEHPPLIKYLFGYSIILFSNPYFAQVSLGVLFLIVFYYLALKIYKSRNVAILASILILIDPLFLDVSSRPLLDLGQTLFMLLYFLSVFFWKEKFILQGLFLALFAGTKFWITPLFFVFFFYGYKIYIKKIHWKMIIFNDVSTIDKQNVIDNPLDEVKVVKQNFQPMANTCIWEDRISLQTFVEPFSVVEIKNKALAEAYLNYFNTMWKVGKDIKEI